MYSTRTMKKIGLIGGLSYPSTITYYERINQLGNQYLGDAHSPRVCVESLDFQRVADWLTTGNEEALVDELSCAAARLINSGAELVAICCNTVHKYAKQVGARTAVPIVNICECVADHAALRGYGRVGLLGSAYSMEEAFYRDEFKHRGIATSIPPEPERRFVQQVIETELSVGEVSAATRRRFLDIAHDLLDQGAETLVLACTEIPLVIRAADLDAPLIDTVEIHAASIVAQALVRDEAYRPFQPGATCASTI
jgi:aspartate racemase